MKKFLSSIRSLFGDRPLWTVIVVGMAFVILIRNLYTMQILNTQEYEERIYEDQAEEYEVLGVRGNIYDCYGRELAVNVTSYSLYYKPDTVNPELNDTLLSLMDVLAQSGEELAIRDVLPIDYNANSGFFYTDRFANPNGTARLNFLAEIFGTKRADLTEEQKRTTAEQAYQQMRDETFSIDESLPLETVLRLEEVRYALFQYRWTPEEPVLIAENISDRTQAVVLEQSDKYKGFYVETVYSRTYPQGEIFAHIVGYTGHINEAELEAYAEKGYTETDRIGKTGLEASFEDTLRGKNGTVKVTYSGRTGERLSEQTISEATRGQDLILTIDADFQRECYNILYQHLKLLLLDKITGTSEDNNKAYSADDIVAALLLNGFFDTSLIQESTLPDARRYTEAFNQEADAALQSIVDTLIHSDTLIADYSDEMIDYFSLVISYLRENDYLSTDYRNDEERVYVRYVSGLTTAYEFLEYCYNGGYFKLEEFGLDPFSTAEEGLPVILQTTVEALRHNRQYEQMVFTNVLRKDLFNMRDFILLCYDLGFLSNEDGSREMFSNDEIDLLNLLRMKIRQDEITPGDINLDPSSGSMIVTDCDTGKVRAIVSYPSYDTNQFLNSYEYYEKVTSDRSSPMLFRALQETRAPGSTFKMCTSSAGLELGYIDLNTFVYDNYAYENVNSVAKPTCWSKISHGSVNVIGALEVSCNYFFYDVGYRLCDPAPDGSFNDNVGLEKLKYYALTLGLGTKTGIELPEAEPLISTQDAVRSAIGQGSHGYTVANINRYTNTIANGGDVCDLYLVDHIQNSDGTVTYRKDTTPVSKADVTEEHLDIIKEGMRLVNTETSKDDLEILDIMGMKTAGKTGTAEESYLHPEHAWYTGYTNFDDPEVSITIVIPYGNGSDKCLPIFKDLVEAYYMLEEPEMDEE